MRTGTAEHSHGGTVLFGTNQDRWQPRGLGVADAANYAAINVAKSRYYSSSTVPGQNLAHLTAHFARDGYQSQPVPDGLKQKHKNRQKTLTGIFPFFLHHPVAGHPFTPQNTTPNVSILVRSASLSVPTSFCMRIE